MTACQPAEKNELDPEVSGSGSACPGKGLLQRALSWMRFNGREVAGGTAARMDRNVSSRMGGEPWPDGCSDR